MVAVALRCRLATFLVFAQIAFILLFAFFTEYDDDAKPIPRKLSDGSNPLHKYYPMFQDVHVMMFIGFGFLMTFLKKYGFSSVGLNMLIAATCIQWGTLCLGLFDCVETGRSRISLGITSLIEADIAAATVLISFGVVLGKTSALQLFVMLIVELVLYATNEWIVTDILKISDVGDSIIVHTFGAYFGLTVSVLLRRSELDEHPNEGSNYQSDLFAMIGTVFLWLYWPSFNAGLLTGEVQHRVVINTYYSLAACCVTAFAISALVDKHGRFNMVHIQNSTLAGGVAIGAAANLLVHPFGALIIGSSAAILSVLGYKYITPFLNSKLGIHDTCGVNNLHGMPGILAAIISSIAVSAASEQEYGYSLYEQYPAMAPPLNSTELTRIQRQFPDVTAGIGRTASAQAGMQIVAMLVTLGIAISGGIVAGVLLRLPGLASPPAESLFDDITAWEVPETEVYKPSESNNAVSPRSNNEIK